MSRKEQDFYGYSFEERSSGAERIKELIPQERIRVQKKGDKIKEMWGFVWLNGLPFCFVAWPDPSGRGLEFLKNGTLGEKQEATWWIHAPYSPINFNATIFTQPIGENDMEYIMKGLGHSDVDVENAKSKGSTRELFTHSLLQQKLRYDQFKTQYENDSFLRGSFGAAVTFACDEKMREVMGS